MFLFKVNFVITGHFLFENSLDLGAGRGKERTKYIKGSHSLEEDPASRELCCTSFKDVKFC